MRPRTRVEWRAAAGFRTLVARNGAEAVALAIDQLPDVILMDLRLPDMDGAEAARILADGLAAAGCAVEPPETNMVYFDPSPAGLSGDQFRAAIEAEGVRMSGAGGRVRAVTHLDVDGDAVRSALAVAGTVLQAA